ncbi:hypothetical protein C10C_0798 [Chlamydia serpentis]|uniref:Uncharacterized protein n=1 Tax=Chlamydia serpentis TaxID=1967782 RepID=A0A2R8FC60_9CHLA|nr:hypothetical protein [Chlamydia serpentis]SPN73941.1 hypothetical protein C10C_0798 [Chlamydia serpentis]
MIIRQFQTAQELSDWGESRGVSTCFCLKAGVIVRDSNSGKLVSPGLDLTLLRSKRVSPTYPILVGQSIMTLVAHLVFVLPIFGTLVGVGRMCAVWGVKSVKDSIGLKIYHTFVAILEILGLGILMLTLKILLVILVSPLLCFSSGRACLAKHRILIRGPRAI